jgi:hypothetical protein
MNISTELTSIDQQRRALEVAEANLIQQGMHSGNPEEIIKAMSTLQRRKGVEGSDNKSYVFSPDQFLSSFGYKDKPMSISYDMLRRMARTPIIKAIISTRIEQIAAFAEPQADKYSTGFVIRKKTRSGDTEEQQLSDKDRRTIDYLTDFILHCGDEANRWHGQSFDEFLRMFTRDSLEMDQATFEVVRNNAGEVVEFLATDAATFRYADSIDPQLVKDQDKLIQGYPPYYVQLYQNNIEREYHPWELCFGCRNPTTDINKNRYGISELEDLVQVVTGMLYGDTYNMKFFSQGSAPKGILRVAGNIGETKLNDFRRQWQTQIAGVSNAWKTPMLEADKMDWIDLQKTNRDMEYSKWQEYLIKLACAAFKIDPSEVGFPMSGGADSKPMFEGNNESRLKYSKDKGLGAILKFIQSKINKYVISQLNPDFEFAFVGMDAGSASEDLDRDIKEVGNFITVNELRARRGMDKIEGGDIILNPTFLQGKGQDAMAAQQAEAGNEDSNEATEEYDNDPMGVPFPDMDKGENPFQTALDHFIKSELCN